ncbi:MAG TPA: SIR2 family protein, partial [Polyangia bacterium]|nr:SIR2 family protein [Polyangia bacterium]
RADGKMPFVLKALGDPRRADTLVWSNEDLQATLGDAEFRAATHELYRSRSFLFVGFDARDLDFEILLERVLAGARAGDGEHFAVLPGASAVEKEELYRAWRIRVLDEEDLGALAEALTGALAERSEPELPDGDYQQWLAILEEDPARADVIARLDELTDELHERGDHEALVELMLGRVAVEREAAKRAQLLLTVARLFEYEADDAEHAFTALTAAYKEEPSLAAWHELERLATAANAWDRVAAELGEALSSLPAAVRVPLCRKLERWAELLAALDEQAAQLGATEARSLELEAAALCAEKLGERAAAIARYQAIAASAPRDLDVLRALEKLYDDDGRADAYLDNLAAQAELTSDAAERAALYRRLALSWEEEEGGAARAEDSWETLLAIEPDAEDALRALERLYGLDGKWPELIETLRRRAARAPKPLQAELFGQIGALYQHELNDPGHAIEAYRLAEAAQSNPETLAALGGAYEQLGAWHQAVELLDRRAVATDDPAHALSLVLRAAELCAVQLADAREAEKRYVRALELAPEHAPAMTALAEIYRKSGELLRAAKLFVEAAVATPNRLERTRLLVDAGEIYEGLDDGPRAVELYLEALAIDPEHAAAGEGAAEILWRTERWNELVPILEMLLRKPTDPPEQIERLVRLARAATALKLYDKAGKAYVRATELNPAHLAAQRGRANHHLAREQWMDALSSLERVFQYHIDDLSTEERVELFSEMGRCELRLGARQGAREFLQRALELDPTHRPSLLAQVELGQADPESLVEAKKALLVTATPDEQVRLLGEIGDLYLTRLGDSSRAIGAWAEALELRADDHKLLHKILDVYVEDRAWAQAVEMLERLIAVEKLPTVRAKYRHTAGLICRDELKRPAAAVLHLRSALDDDATLDRAWQALEQLYTDQQEWKELARVFRALLKRLGPESPGDADGQNRERLRVWSALGDVCWHELGERESALAALEVALTFDRANLDRHKRLADLYVQGGKQHFDKSIAEHQYVLRAEKNRVLSYRALKHLYIQTGQREKSLACSWALEILHKGEPDDARKVAEFKRRPFATARRILTDDAWARLAHPDEDRLLGVLFAIVGPTIVAGQAQPHKSFGLSRKEAIGADDPHSYKKALEYVATTFDVPLPEAYARPEQKEAVLFANCIDDRQLVPVLLLGAPLVGGRRSEAEQVFELARRAAHLKPERLLRLAMPHPQSLAHVIEAAMALAGEQDGEQPATEELQRTVLGFERTLPPGALEQVAAIGRKLRQNGTHAESAALDWLHASDLTALRAGWVMTGDLETCARLAAAEGHPAGTLPPTQRLLELLWSSTTEELFSVRKHLGLV